MLGLGNWAFWKTDRICLRDSEHIIVCNQALLKRKHLLIGITRVRNESLILQDTLDYLGTQVDAIVAYDDASTDDTLAILQSHQKVAMVISNTLWENDVVARLAAETRHRGLLLQISRSKLIFEWILCFDADERIIGDLRGFIHNSGTNQCEGVRIRLFDAYMTIEDHLSFEHGKHLLNFRNFFGPERRDILMLWRNLPNVRYTGIDAREPTGVNNIVTNFHCQHYGKAISLEQWEETCDYYIKYFPFETYGRKWLNRKGLAIHTLSDYSRPLLRWSKNLFDNSIVIN